MADSYRLDKLSLEQKQEFYVLLRAKQRGVDPSEVTVPEGRENDAGWLDRSLSRSLRSFEAGGRLGLLGRTFGKDATPEDELAADYKGYKADPSKPVKATDAKFMEYMALTLYGRDVSLDGNLGNDKDALGKLSGNLDSRISAANVRARGEFDRVRAGVKDATVAADATATAEQAMMTQGVMRAFGIKTGPIDGSIDLKDPNPYAGSGLEGKGHPIDDLLVTHQEGIYRELGGVVSNRDIVAIRNNMFKDPAKGDFSLTTQGEKVMGYLVRETDMRDRVSKLLESGDPDKIKEGQALLKLSGVEGADKIRITGELDAATATVGVAYLETQRGLGKAIFRDTTADRGADGSRPYPNDVATSVVKRNILNGTMVINEALLPEEFRKDLEGLSKVERAEEIATHLTDPKNLQAYNAKAMATARPELAAKLRSKLEEGTLTNEADRLALRGKLVNDFRDATVHLKHIPSLRMGALEARTMTNETRIARTQLAAGNADGAIDTIRGRVDAVVTSIEARRTATVKPLVPFINRIPGYENMDVNQVLAQLDTKGGREKLVADARNAGVPAVEMKFGDTRGSWRRLQSAHAKFTGIQKDIKASEPPKPGGRDLGDPFRKGRDHDGLPLDRRGSEVPVAGAVVDRTKVAALSPVD